MYMTSYPTIKMTSEDYEKVPIEGRNGCLIRNKGTKRTAIKTYKDFIDSDYVISIINYDYRNIENNLGVQPSLEL